MGRGIQFYYATCCREISIFEKSAESCKQPSKLFNPEENIFPDDRKVKWRCYNSKQEDRKRQSNRILVSSMVVC
jgi:hypothetical protein